MSQTSLNKTEQKALEWLVEEKGIDRDEIQRESADQVPDFHTPDGPFEVKRPSSSEKLVMTESQYNRIPPKATVLVFSEQFDEPIDSFRWSERAEADWAIHKYGTNARIVIDCDEYDTKAQWESLVAEVSGSGKAEEAVKKLTAYFEEYPERVGELKQTSRGIQFRR